MRTLSRPMFNMGGPIKQGIMHGIREPYAQGQRVMPSYDGRRPGYAGPATPFLIAAWPHIARVLGMQAIKKGSQHAIKKVASSKATHNLLKNTMQAGGAGGASGAGTGWTGSTALTVIPKTVNKAPGFFKNWWAGDPAVKSVKWLKNAIMSPTAKGWGTSLARGMVSPSSLAIMGGTGLYYGLKDKPIDPPTGLNKPGGFPGAGGKEKATISQAQRDAFAMAQRTKRVQKYLDMMGYDRSKKTAIADALIDASKLVSDRGTLDLKNINRELINPVIQATSKRLDKPEQIREAVGLMATKAEIEKDLTKETDALKTRSLELQIENAENTLAASQSFEGGLSEWLSSRKGVVAANELEQFSRLLARKHKEPFKKVTGDEQITVNGIYMKDGNLFRVTEGVSEQLV